MSSEGYSEEIEELWIILGDPENGRVKLVSKSFHSPCNQSNLCIGCEGLNLLDHIIIVQKINPLTINKVTSCGRNTVDKGIIQMGKRLTLYKALENNVQEEM